MNLKSIMRSLIVTLCFVLGSLGYAANYFAPPMNLQTMINASAGGRLVVSAGTYTTTGLTCAGNFTLDSDGPVFINVGSSATGFDATNCPGIQVLGNITIVGSGPSYSGFNTGTTDPNATQIGFKAVNPSGMNIEGLKIQNIAGTCFDVTAPASAFNVQSANKVHVVVSHCYRGIWAHNFAEYMTFIDPIAFNNAIGIQVDSGNNTFVNPKTVYNSIGVKVCGNNNAPNTWPYCNSTGNNAHGIFTGLTSNHNTYNLIVQDVTLGETFSGSHFIGDQAGGNAGSISVINSKAINIVGGQIGSAITVDATSTVSIQGNYMRTDLPGFGLTNAGTGNTYIKNNFTPTGMWASNN